MGPPAECSSGAARHPSGGRGPGEPPAALARAFAELGANGRRWCLLRPRASATAPAGDVDVLVEPHAAAAVESELRALGWVRMPLAGPDRHLVHHDAGTGRFTWLHVQPVLRVAGGEVPAAAVLAEADQRQPVRVAPDPWLLWILLLRALVDKGELPERHRPHVQALARAGHLPPGPLCELALRRSIAVADVLAEAAVADWAALMRRAPRPPPAPRLSPPTRVVHVLRALTRPRARRGLIVAVLGPDGAGKTTLVTALAESLPLATRVQYMGLTGGRLPRADALRVPGLVLAARLVILWARWLRSAYHRGQGRIVICDRYTFDGAVPSGVPLSPLGRLSRRVQRNALPAPDLALLLDASGTTMYARKREYDAAELERWRIAYRRLRGSVATLEVIDAERSPEAVLRETQALIWRRLDEAR